MDRDPVAFADAFPDFVTNPWPYSHTHYLPIGVGFAYSHEHGNTGWHSHPHYPDPQDDPPTYGNDGDDPAPDR